jgi:hypothetical protein
MIMQLVIPPSFLLRQIEQALVQALTVDDPMFRDVFPFLDFDRSMLTWIQKGNYFGMQQWRGLNNQPPRVSRVGYNQFSAYPGAYGEWTALDEVSMTELRQPDAMDGAPIRVEGLIRECQDMLTIRRLVRMRWVAWTLIATGTYAVLDMKGTVGHQDSYTPRVYAAPVPWSNFSGSKPLFDFSQLPLLARGFSLLLGPQSTAYMNLTTFGNLRQNTNNADLYGRRTQGLGTFNSLDQINQLFLGDGLPKIVLFDDGYLDDTGVFRLYIPDNRVIVVGRRQTGAALGNYLLTRNINNPNFAPGVYAKVIDRIDDVPREIEVHNGHNGGPALYHPEAIIVMQV